MKNTNAKTDVQEKKNMRSFLGNWSVENNISQTSLNSLLSGLRDLGNDYNLPKYAKNLLMTPNQSNHVKDGNFTYCHTGIKANLAAYCSTLKTNNVCLPESIILDFNVDGVKYSRSTTRSLWLIQMNIENSSYGFDPFVVGIYFSDKKPAHSFLLKFVNELNELVTDGFKFGNTNIPVIIGCFVNDTPANSFIRCAKGHAGYSSCMKCTERGLRLDNCLVFPRVTASKRTNEDFRMKIDSEHHHLSETSLLENIEELDMIHSFAIDEMHIVHLGVMKKLIEIWMASSLNKKEINEINIRAKTVERHRPCEIHRTIRAISDFKLFKANEFRTFLMITGPILLKDILDSEKYNHFLSLNVAMRKLTQKNLVSNELDMIQKMLIKNVQNFKKLYGLNKITYVVHQLIHLCDDYKIHGCLKSAYKYENNCGKIARSIRHGKNVAQQIYNRHAEKLKTLSLPKNEIIPIELKRKCKLNRKTIFKAISSKGIYFDNSEKNQWFMTQNKEICSFTHAELIDGKIKIICKKISEKLENFFDVPLNSMDIDIYCVKNLHYTTDSVIDYESIDCKMFMVPSLSDFVFVPIINYNNII